MMVSTNWNCPSVYNHEPPDYSCPFCAVAAGQETESVYTVAGDVVLRNELVIGFVSSHWWPCNPGHAILIPSDHYENIYDLPDSYGAGIFQASRRIALAMKTAYGCDGVSTRQHNEPAGYQDVWHFHLHVFPRYTGDQLYTRTAERYLTTPSQRRPYAEKLRTALAQFK